MPHIRFFLFIAENALSLVAFVTSITNMNFESLTSHTAFTCSKKSIILYLCQRVIGNRYKIDTNRASITNWGKIITNRGSSSCYKSGQ